MNLKKIGKVLTSKFVGTGPSSYEKRIYRAAASQRLRNTALHSMFKITSIWYVSLVTGFEVKWSPFSGCMFRERRI